MTTGRAASNQATRLAQAMETPETKASRNVQLDSDSSSPDSTPPGSPQAPAKSLAASSASIMRSASSAALTASAAAVGAPVVLVRSAASLVMEPKQALAAALSWTYWQPIPLHARKPSKEDSRGGFVRLEVKLLNGTDVILQLPVSTTLLEAGEHVARTGLPARRQFFVVAEDRARAGGLGSLAKSVTRQLIAPRDLRASLVSWINFVFLPEAVNRELYGRGLIGSLKASTWYQQLQEKQGQGKQRRTVKVKNAVRVQVETLAGQVVAVDVDAEATLGAMREGIARQTGIVVKQQRFIILERSGPGALTHLTNSMFLQTLAGAKTLMGAAAWAACTLLGSHKDNRFPLTVRCHTGEQVVLSVTGDMSLDQVRELVEARTGKPEMEPDEARGRPVGSPRKDATTAVDEVLLSGKPPTPTRPLVSLAEIGFPEHVPAPPQLPQLVQLVDI